MQHPHLVLLAPLLLACGGKIGGPPAQGNRDDRDAAAAAPVADAAYLPIDAPAGTCSPTEGCDAGTCWLSHTGAHVCVHFTVPPAGAPPGTVCDAGRPEERALEGCCISHDQCPQPFGRCMARPYCGGVSGRQVFAYCVQDAWCTGDGDCEKGGVCTPTSVLGGDRPRCVYGSCRTSADCTRGPGGECLLGVVGGGPCSSGYTQRYCHYANDVCHPFVGGTDCPGESQFGWTCRPKQDGHGTQCVERAPTPP